MADFVPYPFGRLAGRLLRELQTKDAAFDLPRRAFWVPDPKKDLAVAFHAGRTASPLGPAAGPHTQLAQNIVLSWLGGARVIELKTVQALDELKVPRPCIDMRNVGYNVEWSQELRVAQSLEEYVKASMLIDLLRAAGVPAVDVPRPVFDMSVGYDLAGVRGDKVRAFVAGMRDAKALIDRLRRDLPAPLRDTAFVTNISNSVTLSTFHGCPPREIEGIADHLMGELGLDTVIKLNPTLLGPAELKRLLHDRLGYTEVHVPAEAFEDDADWEQVCGFVGRLRRRAKDLGRGFGVKLTNTLVVENREGFLPSSEKTMYLSGPPLHVLAVRLVRRFRTRFGARLPISFSGGIDRLNFPDAVSLGLVPVTVCSDLLGPGGYSRLRGYSQRLVERMEQAKVPDIPDFIIDAQGQGPAALKAAGFKRPPSKWEPAYQECVDQAVLLNTKAYAAAVVDDPRYARPQHSAAPKKVGRKLELFDCLTCDKCVPACPNGANFTLVLPQGKVPILKLSKQAGVWRSLAAGELVFDKKHQLANFADFCNECGNCDVFCPEDGGPYRIKPRFFGSRASWEAAKGHDGFHLERRGAAETMRGRFSGKEFQMTIDQDRAEYSGEGFHLRFLTSDPAGTVSGDCVGEVDLAYFQIMDLLRKALYAEGAVNYVNS